LLGYGHYNIQGDPILSWKCSFIEKGTNLQKNKVLRACVRLCFWRVLAYVHERVCEKKNIRFLKLTVSLEDFQTVCHVGRRRKVVGVRVEFVPLC
jgi:hypothetical protein